ncbi:eukaryotic translation initiation factor 4B3-like [Andrographis paniculata]|uniref:eukaryotic translation initiation factor 4B3-like n=1 Tax=Andrographis paniculata TaxID=175694 RepID=UPI0021E6F093|nr:eukaryotic translation initiation factor 4B3-like [Andrographis paniculata]
MAATASAWTKPGGWALDSEENEADLLQQHKSDAAASKGVETSDFPSLAAAAAATKTKKKKPQTLSLQEFAGYRSEKSYAADQKGLTPDELLALPTGPRQRSAEELDRNKLGGGFRSYGGGMRDEQPRRQGSFNRESNREFAPSRADEIDNWAAGKKSPGNNGFERRDRGGRGGFFTDSQSRADEVDNWASNKSFVPAEHKRYEKRGSFGSDSSNGGADSSNWGKRKEEEGRKIGGSFDSLRERRGGFESNGADSDNSGWKREEGSVGGRPRLNLQPRTLPLSEEQKLEVSGGAKPKGSSPFGEARPREEVLKEKGQDWKEIEEKLESTKIKDVASDGPVEVAKKTFWSGNGRDRSRVEERTEGAWRKPEPTDSSPQSAIESENGTPAENAVNGHPEESEVQGTVF